jgi:hypothetical protein
MRLNTARIPFVTGDEFVLYPIGDIHFGSANCDVKLLDEVIAEVRENPKALWIGMGDAVESIAPNDKRWHAGGVDERVVSLANQDRIGDVYVEKLAAKLRPIASQCIAYGDGNHEASFNKHYYTNLSVRVLDAIGRPDCYTEWSCLTRIVFGHATRDRSLPVRVFHSHGWQAGRQEGGKVNESRRLLAYIEADVYLSGHSHSKWVVPHTRLETDVRFTKLVAHEVYTAHTGSFLRTLQQDHVGYAESAGYPPTSTGVVKFVLKPEEDKVRISAVQGG